MPVTSAVGKAAAARCPACASEKAAVYARKRSWQIWQCNDCRTCFVHPQPSTEELAHIYSTAAGYFASAETDLSKTSSDAAGRLDELLRRLGIPGAGLLDVGCATGQLMYHMRERGWQVHGLDPNAGAVEVAKAHGLDARAVPLDEAAFEEQGTGAICRNGPEGASHKWCLSPFSPRGSTRSFSAT